MGFREVGASFRRGEGAGVVLTPDKYKERDDDLISSFFVFHNCIGIRDAARPSQDGADGKIPDPV